MVAAAMAAGAREGRATGSSPRVTAVRGAAVGDGGRHYVYGLHAVAAQIVAPDVLSKFVGDVAHQGVVARLTPLAAWNDDQLFEHLDALDRPAFLLVLDGVTDPHNLGACLRSADAAGVDAVVIPKDRSSSASVWPFQEGRRSKQGVVLGH